MFQYVYWETSACKWTHTIQTHVVQGSAALRRNEQCSRRPGGLHSALLMCTDTWNVNCKALCLFFSGESPGFVSDMAVVLIICPRRLWAPGGQGLASPHCPQHRAWGRLMAYCPPRNAGIVNKCVWSPLSWFSYLSPSCHLSTPQPLSYGPMRSYHWLFSCIIFWPGL